MRFRRGKPWVVSDALLHALKRRRIEKLLDDIDGRMELFLLSLYPPCVNPIEGLWLFLKPHVLDRVGSEAELMRIG